jgi:lipopolysaccharide export system protein LptA
VTRWTEQPAPSPGRDGGRAGAAAIGGRAAGLVVLAAACLVAAAPAVAQPSGGKDRQAVSAQSPNSIGDAFKGFGSNSKDPIQIEADSLEVRDRDNMAVFTGNVVVRQKDTVLKSQLLRVFYEPGAGPGAAPAPGSSTPPAQQIRRYEAEGKVLIAQGDQTVSGETGWFDMRSSKAQINTNVVLTQGKNVGTGGRIDVDLRTGQYVLSSPAGSTRTGQRPTLVIEPTQQPGGRN